MRLLSIGDQVRPGLYRLHSRFDRAVNFERAGRLVSVVDETIGPGPLSIVLRDLKPALAQGYAEPALSILKGLHPSAQGWIASPVPGDPTLGNRPRKIPNPEGVESPSGTTLPLCITASTVLFEDHRYRFTSRHRYNSTLDLQALDPARYRRNLSTLGDALLEDAPPGSLAFVLDSTRLKNFRRGVEQTVAGQIGRGVHQVFHGNLLEGIRQLRGCGFGLTPAGDDFIAGLLLGLHLLQRLRGQELQPTVDAIFRAARGGNIFSNTFLDLARRGLMFGGMKDLLLAMMSGTRPSLRKAAKRLFAVGETSGADLATGLFMTLQFGLATADRPSAHPVPRCRRRAGR